MHGLGRALGCGIPVTLAGRTWLLGPLTLGVLGTVENHLLARRGTPEESLVRGMGDGINSALGLTLLKESRDDLRRNKGLRVIEVEELWEFLDGREGMAMVAWLCCQDAGGRPAWRTLEQAAAAVRRASAEERVEFRRRRDIAAGTDAAAVADWPAAGTGMQSRWMAWRKVVRDMAEAMQPVGVLRGITSYELRVLTADPDTLGGIKSVPAMGGQTRKGRRHEKGLPTAAKPTAAGVNEGIAAAAKPREATPHPLRAKLLKEGKFRMPG